MEDEAEEESRGEASHPQQEEPQPAAQGAPPKSQRAKKKGESEQEMLEKEYSKDHSIIAHEIACYLHACCVKFGVRIE